MVAETLRLYRGCTPVVDTHARGDCSLAVAIVEAVATAAGVEPNELPPLFGSIDTDAIDELFHHDAAGEGTFLGFQVDRWNVFVDGTGHIRVCDATRPTDEPEPVFA